MNPTPPPIPSRDAEHLRLLEIFHYVVGGIMALFASIPIIHVFVGLVMILNPDTFANKGQGEAPPAFVGYLFAGIGSAAILIGWTMALLTAYSGRMIKRRQRRIFSIVIAAILCAFAPFGTVLGIFTIIVLTKESVMPLYEETQLPAVQNPIT
jgi:hypothetical protein